MSFAIHASKGGLAYVDIGATDLPVRAQSVRKSLMNALIGAAFEKGLLHPETTLGDLVVDDIEGLSDVELSATVRDVVMARSGIYHPAAYQPVPAPTLPPRGTDRPGDRWTYNNWDFNVLGSILQTAAGLGTYDAFDAWIARPLDMQEFDPHQNEYTLESMSRHPAYDFRISARDLSRFGLLYLRHGRWRDAQVIPAEWVGSSTYPWSAVPAPYAHVMAAFGYLWWIGRPDDLGGREFFAALGGQGHALFVVPKEDIVVVHRNHDHETNPPWTEVLPLLRRTIDIAGELS
jgi:CubicO group peptidase (beta-lactamase class C family)